MAQEHKATNTFQIASQDLFAWMQILKLPVLYLSDDYEILNANDQVADFFSQPLDQVLHHNFQEICSKNHVDLPVLPEKGQMSSGQTIHHAQQYNPMKKTLKSFQWVVQSVVEKRKLVGYLLIIKDISLETTERKKSDEIKKFYDNLIALMPGNIYWVDRDGIYQGCNNNVATYLRLGSPEAIVGKTYEDLYDLESVKSLRKTDTEVMDSGLPKTLEEGKIDEHGNHIVYLTNKVPYRDEQGNVTGLLGISIDISERKRAEELAHQARKKAEAANAAKSQFIENMQHDLRTPVIGIAGMLDMWAKEETDPEKKKLFLIMALHAKDLRKMFDDILHFTHIEANDLPVLEQKFHVHKLVEGVINIEKPAAFMKGFNITSKINKNVPEIVKGDYFRLQSILVNLLSNAVKFTKKGSVSLQIKKKTDKNTEKNQVFLKFVVADTGIGISKSQQARIYEKFVKLDPSNRSGNYRGSGLGLTIVKRFVEDLGGEIDLVSRVGEGSKFTIVVPLSLSILNEPDKEDFEEKIFFN